MYTSNEFDAYIVKGQEGACNPNPCKNGGTCKSSGNPAKAYTCICSTGYTGINCEGKVLLYA